MEDENNGGEDIEELYDIMKEKFFKINIESG